MAASDYVAGIYSQLLQLQQSFLPFSVTSGLRTYDTMLIKSLRVNRDQTKQYVIDVFAVLRQIILVSTQTSTLPAQTALAVPASSADVVNWGSAQLQQVPTSPLGFEFLMATYYKIHPQCHRDEKPSPDSSPVHGRQRNGNASPYRADLARRAGLLFSGQSGQALSAVRLGLRFHPRAFPADQGQALLPLSRLPFSFRRRGRGH